MRETISVASSDDNGQLRAGQHLNQRGDLPVALVYSSCSAVSEVVGGALLRARDRSARFASTIAR